MAHIQWKDRYNIGFRDIDAQHKVLLDLLNDLIDLVGERRDAATVAGIFQRLCEYVRVHFSTEEAYLKEFAYPRLAEHQALHATFTARLIDLDSTYDPTDPRLLSETLDFLKHWYLEHITRADQDYVPFLPRDTEPPPIQAIIFDFGNVQYRFDNGRILAGLAQLTGRSTEALKQAVYDDASLSEDYEAGRIDSQAFLAGVSALCGRDLTEAEFLPIFTGHFTPIDSTLELIRRLKPAYRIGLLSNTNPWHFEHGIRTTPVFPLYDTITLSYEVGVLKPEPRIYQDAVAKLGLPPEACVYIDDLAPFAEAATKLGLHGLTYTTPVALMAQLRQLRVAF